MKEIRGGIDMFTYDKNGESTGEGYGDRVKDYFLEKNPSDGRSAFGDDVRKFGTKIKEKASKYSPFRKKTEGGKRKSKAKKSKKSKKGSKKNKTRRR